ncbi:MAG TPA: PAS domain S-box protein [Actinobacteria bacterium]|nr:PAS domain S-box protein [Actinomycetota bacterium]
MSVTNHKPVQNKIAEGMFCVAFDTAAVVMIGLSPNHEILGFNQEAEHLYDMRRDEVLGKNYFQLFLPKEVWTDVASDIKKVLAGEPTKGFENIIRRKDGEERLLSWNVSRFLDQQEKPQGIVAVGHDITEQRALKEQRRSQKLYQITIENISDTVIITDDEGVFTYVCTNIDVIFGYSAEEVLTSGKIETILGQTPFELSKLREEGEIPNIEMDIVDKSGNIRSLLVNVKNVDIFGGTILYSCRDITERKQAEKLIIESKELSEALNRIDVSISSTLDFNEIIQRAIKESVQTIGCESAALILREEDSWLIRYMYRLGENKVGTRLSNKNAKHLALVAKTKELLFVDDAYVDARVDQELMKSLGIRSFLAIPLIIKEKVIGVLAFHYLSSTGGFSEPEIDFAGKVASSVSLAIENARLYSDQRNIADTLQETFLTVPKKIKELDFGHLYHAATEATKVGGDFFDLFELEKNKICILIGDVSGKGLEAAKMTSMIKNTIHAHSHEENSPAEILKKSNKSAYKTIPPSSFITVFLGILNRKTGVLTYCNAGHPPPIVRRISGRSSFLDIGNNPIGVLEEVDYSDRKVRLKDGDVLFAHTDGLIEARRDTKFYGEKRLRKAVKELASIPAPELPQAIFDQILEFTDGKLVDDIAILSVSLERKRDCNKP